MTSKSEETEVAISSTTRPGQSYLEWGSIFGGILVAGAISVVLTQFGVAAGLSVGAPTLADGSASWNVLLAGLWLALVAVASASAGGYLSGRMRARRNDAVEAEVEVRDGSHGLVVWAGATLVVAAFGALSATLAAASAAPTTEITEEMARIGYNSALIFSFATAASAALSAAAAWFAGIAGGAHRDAGLTVHEVVPAFLRKSA